MADEETRKRVLKKWEEDSLANSSPCSTCAHYIVNGKKSFVCCAYPEGIHNVIFRGEVDYREPHPGDHGIQYDKKLISLEHKRFKRKIRNYGKDS